MMEKYSGYCFKIIPDDDNWVYEIHDQEYPELPALRISDEFFETEQEARFGVIGHLFSPP